jgi:Domain of unknown function (DUF1857)
MRFEHLVQINDPLQPLLTEVTRRQLWRGLVRRAEQPTEFVLGLVGATIEERIDEAGAVQLARTLDFGSFKVRDRVRLTGDDLSVTDVEASDAYAASRLTIRIEEPAAGSLFLRFTYESSAAPGSGELDTLTQQFREQAYRSADIDTVWRIRDLVERGELG